MLGHVDKRYDPQPYGDKVEVAHEGHGGLVVAGCDTAHLLELAEHPLNAVTVPVTPPVCFLRRAAAFT